MRLDLWDALGVVIDGFRVGIAVVCLICGIVTLLIVLWGLRRLISRLRESLQVADSWHRAVAVVTAVSTKRLLPGVDETGSPVADYSFSDSTGRTFVGSDDGLAFTRPVVGMRFPVAYDPDDPSASHPAARIRGRIAAWAVMFGILLLLLLLCCSVLFFWQGLSVFS